MYVIPLRKFHKFGYPIAFLGISMLPLSAAVAADNPAGSTISGQLGSLTDTVFTNEGTIYNPATSGYTGAGIYAGSANTVINNAGTITATGNAPGVYLANNGSITSFINTGSIISQGATAQAVLLQTGSVNSFTNSGLIKATGGYNAIWFQVPTTIFVNTGTVISGGWNAIYNTSTIGTITNTGSIYSTSSGGYHYGIYNDGTITTLNNGQGGSSPLLITQHLPVNYNVIIRSASNYGSLSGTSISGSTTFGVYTGSLITQSSYANVLSGLSASNLTTTSGSYGTYQWQLVNAGGNQWNLVFTNFTTNLETQESVKATASAVAVARGLQNALLANSLRDYDCTLFDRQDLCLSGGVQAMAIGGESAITPGGVLIGAYRLNPQWRVGVYLDQPLSNATYDSTVRLEARDPAVGVFGVWNEQPDGLGAEVKLAAAYSRRDTTITRPIVDGVSEPGSGSTALTSMAAMAMAKYGIPVRPDVVLSPYAGLRYTHQELGGYTEGQSNSVTLPLTYAALISRALTALAGLSADWRLGTASALRASLGVEADIVRQGGDWVATGITGLAPVSLGDNGYRNRAIATVGVSCMPERTQRLSFDVGYRQEEYTRTGSTNVLLTYTVGF